jgi:glycosyltransferase involved in cell wall biosynthesis
MPGRTAALIPAFRAGATIAGVVRATRRHLAEVVVVDDGSDDDTAAAAFREGARVLGHPENRGKGAAIRTGFRELAAAGVARAVALDADGQHLPDEIPKLLAAADDAPGALVLAIRDTSDQPVAPIRRFANWLADTAIGVAAGRTFADTQCGLRVYPILETLALGATGDRMDFESEVLILAARAGMPVREVGVRVYYPPPEERLSHYRLVEDTLRIAWKVLEAPWRPAPTWRPAGSLASHAANGSSHATE